MLLHSFVSAKPDGADATKLRPSDWNAEHVFGGGALGSLLYRDTGVSNGASWLADVAAGSVLVSGGAGAAPAWSATPSLTDVTLAGVGKIADGTAANPSFVFSNANTTGLYRNTSGNYPFGVSIAGTERFGVGVGVYRFNATTATVQIGTDAAATVLTNDAANTLALRNSTNAQAFRLYETFTDSSNYARVTLDYAAGVGGRLFTSAAGTGTARELYLGAAATLYWKIATTGHFLANTDNSYDIGASGATRPRTIYVGTSLVLPGGTLLTTSAALTNGAAAATGTLTNAPTAGNPTKWIPINDNGTTRYIPAW